MARYAGPLVLPAPASPSEILLYINIYKNIYI